MSLRIYIKNRFGSRRGLLRSAVSEVQRVFGIYKQCEKVDLSNVKRLIFVCSGNICRSPLGEAVARTHGVVAESFGLDTRGGDPADPRVVTYAAEKGIDLSLHRTRRIESYMPEPGDLLIGMEPAHYQKLKLLYGDKVAITLAGLWLEKPTTYLHDPYNTNPNFFNNCSSLVTLSATQLSSRMKVAEKAS